MIIVHASTIRFMLVFFVLLYITTMRLSSTINSLYNKYIFRALHDHCFFLARKCSKVKRGPFAQTSR